MRLGIFARTFADTDPRRALAAVAAAGFSVTQYNMACSGLPSMPDAIAAEVTDAVRAAVGETQIEIVAISGTYNMIHPDPAVRSRGHARLRVLAAAARALPTRLVTLCTGSRDPDDMWRAHPANTEPAAWTDLIASIETALRIAEDHDLDLGIEPELANVVNSAARARRLIDDIGSPRLKVVLDPANLFEIATLAAQRRLVAEAIDLLADRIVLGHAKDRTASGGFAAAGSGVLDYPHYLSRLKRSGFEGPLVAHGLAASEAPTVARFLRHALDEAGIGPTR